MQQKSLRELGFLQCFIFLQTHPTKPAIQCFVNRDDILISNNDACISSFFHFRNAFRPFLPDVYHYNYGADELIEAIDSAIPLNCFDESVWVVDELAICFRCTSTGHRTCLYSKWIGNRLVLVCSRPHQNSTATNYYRRRAASTMRDCIEKY